MSETTSWASAMEADHAFHGPYSNTLAKTLTAATPALLDFTQDGLKPGLYDWYLTDPSAAIDLTMKVSIIHLASDANAAALQAAHTPATNGTPSLLRLFPASTWSSLRIPPEFPKLSVMLIGVNATIVFVKRYPGA